MINVSELIDDPDFCTTFAVTRATNGITQSGPGAGELVVASALVGPFTGVIQPNTNPDALAVLPEGLRNDRAIIIWSRERLYYGGDGGGTDDISDYVSYGGSTWRVYGGRDWGQHGYCESWAVESS